VETAHGIRVVECDILAIEHKVAIIELEIVDSWGEPLLPLLAFDVFMRDGHPVGTLRQAEVG
jgi:hypothetical protein